MIMLAIRSDKVEAELYLYDGTQKIGELKWEAHRTLADTLHVKIELLLKSCGKTLSDLEKIGVYAGPGSFTGLRIGISVANALGYSLGIPVVSASGEEWLDYCIQTTPDSFIPITPEYGSEPHITAQKK